MTRIWVRSRQVFRQTPTVELVLLLGLGALLLAGAAVAVTDLIPPPTPLDFSAYYLAAQAQALGQSPYDQQVIAALAAGQGGIPIVVPLLHAPAPGLLCTCPAIAPLRAH
jgi:hypothetical protein